jgi:hydrogenase maturation protease
MHLLRNALLDVDGGAAVKAVVIAVGNPYRGDDGAGLAFAQLLAGRVPEGVAVVECEQEPTRLLDAWQGADAALVVDAVQSGAAAGTIHRFDASALPVPASAFRASTHAFSVGEAVELARALGRLPPRVLVYGIEGAEFQAGSGLSEPVQAALPKAAAVVVADVEELCTSTP